jgi:excisionase family DNA binding protein
LVPVFPGVLSRSTDPIYNLYQKPRRRNWFERSREQLFGLALRKDDGDGRERERPAADALFTIKEVASRLKLNPRTVHAGIKSGKDPFALRDRRSIRISGRKLDQWIANRVGR